ncbi:MAG: flagellar basal-body rod protein FlgB [Armatimonadetes bacterium 55-13]|nr:MAG: flagellar basal-body rod protein FlgB [Armatimonadetes bacterium 55-13]
MRGGEPTVRILDQLFSQQLNNLQNAMGRTTERQAMLTGNLANANTPGYKRKDMDFNIVLDAELHPSDVRMQEMRDRQAQMRSDRSSIRLDGSNVDMEREVMSLAETELRYQALTDMTASYFSGLKNVIREGR